MNFPINFHLSGITISSHLVFEILAYSVGFRYYLWLRRRSEDLISDANRLWIFIGAAAGGLLGSRMLGVLEDPRMLIDSQHTDNQSLLRQFGWMAYLHSKTIVGGLLGGLIGVELTKKWIGVKTSSGDLMVYPVILGMVLGRIGCFLAGVTDGTHGSPCGLPWCMNLGDGTARHPAALYEIVFLVLLGLGILFLESRYTLTNGSRFKILLASYLLFRFFIEFIKPVYRFDFGLSTIQLACLAGLGYYYRVFLFPSSLIAEQKREKIVSFKN